jgi:G3E family GTPase
VLDTGSFSLERVAADLAPEQDHDHDHDHVSANGIASVSLRLDAALDGAAIEDWIGRLIADRGADILRMKGVLSVAGEPRRVVVQSVNMLYEGDYGRPWSAEPRASRLVFIGRGLDADELRAGFAACRAAA